MRAVAVADIAVAMTGSTDHPTILLDFGSTGLIGEVLAAQVASPIRGVAILGAGSCLGLEHVHSVVERHGLHYRCVKGYRPEDPARGYSLINRKCLFAGAGCYGISETVHFPDPKLAINGLAASIIDQLHLAGTGNICIDENHRDIAVCSDGNILCAFDGQCAVHCYVLVGDAHIAGASDIRITEDGWEGAVRSDRDILCIGYGQADSGERPTAVQYDVRTAIAADHSGHRIKQVAKEAIDGENIGVRIVADFAVLVVGQHIAFIDSGDLHAVDDDAVIGNSIYCTHEVFGISHNAGRFDCRITVAGEDAVGCSADVGAVSAGSNDRTAVDGNIANTITPAADACTVSAGGIDLTAVDGNIAMTPPPRRRCRRCRLQKRQ